MNEENVNAEDTSVAEPEANDEAPTTDEDSE